MTGEQMFLNEMKDYVNSGMSKNDLKTLINQRLKHLTSAGENDALHVVSVALPKCTNCGKLMHLATFQCKCGIVKEA